MTWTAVIPLRGQGERKTRLAGRLDPEERKKLSDRLFENVADVLRGTPQISSIALLSDLPREGWHDRFFPDEGGGLNAELRLIAALIGPEPLLVIHADLPLVSREDIALLLAQAGNGCAIAPDRHGSGTNALALRDPPAFAFAFGPGSFARHLAEAGDGARVVKRLGLSLDIDTPDDLDAAIAAGFALR